MSETAAPYQGLYINLDRSTERRAHMQAQLGAFGWESRYSRFAATDGKSPDIAAGVLKPGEIGAFHSHCRALEHARGLGVPVHILEDDAVLSRHLGPVLEDAVAAKLFDRYDLLFTDIFVNCHLGLLKSLKASFDRVQVPPTRSLRLGELQLFDLAGQNFACLTSYAVGHNALGRIGALCRQELDRGPRLPIDLFIRNCVLSGQLRAACVVPFVTSFDFDEVAKSTIAGNESGARPSVMVLAALRYSFFVDRDLARASACLDAATASSRPARDPHRELIVEAVDFVLSDKFQEF